MSKQSSGGAAGQPKIPEVSLEVWSKLLSAADDFNDLAPWKWMHDSQITGVRLPATKELLLGSILGRMKTVFALVLYRNAAGHRWLLNTIQGNTDVEEDDSAFSQDVIKADFVLKRELAKEDRAILSAVKFSSSVKGSRVWPQFRSMAPGGYPWHVTQAEAEKMLFALPRVAALARLSQEHPTLWENHGEGEIAFLPDDFDPSQAELRPEHIDWQPMIPPPEPLPESVSLDEVTIKDLKMLKQAKGFHLELDVSYSGVIVVADVNGPRLPKLAMAVDRASGFVGGFNLGDAKDHDGAAALGVVLRDTLAKFEARPEAIFVQRPRVAAMLKNVATELGVPVRAGQLEELNAARENMEAYFRRR